MTSIDTPGDILRELNSIREMAEKGVTYLAEAEQKFVRLESEADRIESLAFLECQGSVADRTHIARLKSLEARQDAELAKVEVSRVKLKLKQLSEAQMNIQTQARMIELDWKTVGHGRP